MLVNNSPENKPWVICPYCHKPNPVGREFCQYCWSPKIQSEKALTNLEMEEAVKQWKAQVKRKRNKNILIISTVSLIVAAIFTLFILYTRTDVFFKPIISLNSNSTASDWTMFRQNQQRTGVSGQVEQLPVGKVLWTFAASAGIHSSPAVVDGTVYVGSRDYKLYAIDAATGKEKWAFKTGSWVESSPAVANGVVYFGSNDGYFYAVKRRNWHQNLVF